MNPLLPVGGDVSGVEEDGVGGGGEELDEGFVELGVFVDGEDEHVEGDVLLELRGEHEVYPGLGEVTVFGPGEDADEFDLAEAGFVGGDGGGGGSVIGVSA